MKIRTITGFIQINYENAEKKIKRCREFISTAKNIFLENGFEVQTVRVTLNPFYLYTNPNHKIDTLNFLGNLDKIAKENNIEFLNIGCAETPLQTDLLEDILNSTSVISASAKIDREKYIDMDMLKSSSALIKHLGESGNKSFNFCASMNVKSTTPFYPASYTITDGFAIGTENGDIIQEAFKNCNDLKSAHANLSNLLMEIYSKIESVAHIIEKENDFAYFGIDTSFAPGIEMETSVMKSFDILQESLMKAEFPFTPDYLSIAALLTDISKNIPVRRTGYCGLMLPVCEDKFIAESVDAGKTDIDNLLALSSVCGCGLDTVPISGFASDGDIMRIIHKTAVISMKYDKPLSVRLLPVKGKNRGEFSDFDSKYLVNCRIL